MQRLVYTGLLVREQTALLLHQCNACLILFRGRRHHLLLLMAILAMFCISWPIRFCFHIVLKRKLFFITTIAISEKLNPSFAINSE